MAILTKKSKEFLFKYLNNASPTGFEAPGQQIWLDYIKPYIDEYHVDTYGTVYGVINPEATYKVVIEAHADEISWFVNYISESGFINVIRNGGSDHQIAPSKKINIHTPKGMVTGVFGWPAIHTRKGGKEEGPKLNNIFIDVGAANKKEVLEMGIDVGCVCTYPDELFEMNNKFFVGRALDNRMGGFCIAEVARLLKKNRKKLPFGLYIVNAVQEEVGLRGAQMIANKIKPDVAIVTDVTHDTHTPMLKPNELGDIKAGNGPTVTFGPSVHNILQQLIIDTAKKQKIPLQREAASRFTGTDTDAFAYSNQGVPSALISLPLRYMHTTVETAHQDDVMNVIKLIYQTLLRIKKNHNFKYLK